MVESEARKLAVIHEPGSKLWFADKEAAVRILEENDARTGFVFDPTATPAEVRKLMVAQEIRPEENVLSRDIVRTRYEEE